MSCDHGPSGYDEQQATSKPGRPQINPAASPRERTRLRVQRYRDQQHLTRAQQIVHWFADSEELPPTLELSALTLRDGPAHSSSVPDEVETGPDHIISDDESVPGPEAEAILVPLSSDHHNHHLSSYVEEGDDDGDGAAESFGFDNIHDDVVPDPSPDFYWA
ncbi:hypothetical protein Forpi1262_v005517 [Fusarium oxysporum f. sp. raphani]|uniref:Uncharacterized protein n=1 Tax=Fusarium oxysporum f. sp. raphani TaxID=96318 RepID=A0A8J5UFJ3_FUSOX|nr:hypothetical protein Forpi1262_v005517 [Fusarium oxysporum f. sp. raphani]